MTLRELLEQSGQSVEDVLAAKVGEYDRGKGIMVSGTQGYGLDEPPVEITIVLRRV